MDLESETAACQLRQSAESTLREKGSKFIARAVSVRNEMDINHQLNLLKEAHPQASHICYAWVLDQPELLYRYSDDGEPNNSAGLPIYRQLLSHKLRYTLLAVVRYFGGKKLGVSGLIAAYGGAAESVIQAAGMKPYVVKHFYRLTYNREKHYKLFELQAHYDLQIIENDLKEGTALISREGHEMPPISKIPHHFAIFDIEQVQSI